MENLTTGLLSKQQPIVIDDLNNGQGTFMYNHNITEVNVKEDEQGNIVIVDDPKEATGKAWLYDSLRVEYPKTADHIFSTLLTAKYPSNRESKLVNEYQSAVMGLLDKSYKKPYEDFLKDRLAIRASVDKDCETLNIPTDL